MANIALIWLRNDLRLHDHPAFARAQADGFDLLPVYCFDPRQFSTLPLTGLPKTGAIRTQFIFECLTSLKQNIQEVGGALLIANGKPEDVLPSLALQWNAKAIYYTQECTIEEVEVEANVIAAIKGSIPVRGIWGNTLVHLNSLPFDLESLPNIFTEFKKKVEARWKNRTEEQTPLKWATVKKLPNPQLPTFHDLGLSIPEADGRTVVAGKGGETAALNRLAYYFFERDHIAKYKETRNGLLGVDYSTKLSPWLAKGCISPLRVFHEAQRYERERIANDSTYWVGFELLWRDYFKFVALAFGNKLFLKGGLQSRHLRTKTDSRLFECWRTGQTGVPFIDANMRELIATGYMSNRGRQNVASYLVADLKLDWRLGAEWFESQLIDYDPASNYGNWNYLAGIGNDPRGHRYFNVLKQAVDYDPEGHFVRQWVPELKDLPPAYIQTPWQIPKRELEPLGVLLGKTYPLPIAPFKERY